MLVELSVLPRNEHDIQKKLITTFKFSLFTFIHITIQYNSNSNMEAGLFMARVAEQGDRYDDMFNFLREGMIKGRKDGHFTPDERNLMSVCFKHLVTAKRTTWRTIIAVE